MRSLTARAEREEYNPPMGSEGVVDGLPPGPSQPAWFQGLGWALRPTALLREAEREYGEIFTLRGLAGPHACRTCSCRTRASSRRSPRATATRCGPARPAASTSSSRSSAPLDPAAGRRDAPAPAQAHAAVVPRRAHAAVRRAHRDRDRAAHGELAAGEPFELQEEFQHITLDVILRAVFGFDTGPALTDARKHIRSWLHMLASPWAMVPFLRNNSDRASRGRPPPASATASTRSLYALIPERRADPRRRRARRRPLDADRRARRERRGDDRPRAARRAGHPADRRPRDDRHRDGLGGRAPATHPDKLAALRADLPRGDDYLNAVIHETMRLRPPIPLFDRLVCEPIEVLGYRIPTGTVMACNIFAAHRREDAYPQPLEFRPERFLDVASRDLLLDPVRRRCAAVPGRGVRAVRDADRAAHGRRAHGAAGGDPQPSRYYRRAIVLGPRSQARVALPA